ncbi:hypothetical protein GCM10009706_25130 [Curtobacterium citreum]|uniref:Uncharacterized protein n=1 Tax=Curtobacterium citreum TaxID=2036 RepID=A0ABT2HK64_9MICO|nr:hypothetical protein [Curtobacterium citreum]MCS6523668.1 hypothetical protein [Curtobacterium citreum]TQJ26540.1 hypothetical protein FB462_0378 [Curtobacterium citreum]GGL85454.1 hypothetical protein GCM10009706_25130 [Curtobacterium citreum]
MDPAELDAEDAFGHSVLPDAVRDASWLEDEDDLDDLDEDDVDV